MPLPCTNEKDSRSALPNHSCVHHGVQTCWELRNNGGNPYVRFGSSTNRVKNTTPVQSRGPEKGDIYIHTHVCMRDRVSPFPCTHRVHLVRRRQLHALERVTSLGLTIVNAHNEETVRRERHHAPALAAHEAKPDRAAPSPPKGQGVRRARPREIKKARLKRQNKHLEIKICIRYGGTTAALLS